MYLLGYDIGSSSIKAALVRPDNGGTVCLVQSPAAEMKIHTPVVGWAEQHPVTWWKNVCIATKKLLKVSGVKPEEIMGIGISYQMHGLVLVDKKQEVLRPAIIWCDSRAVEIGEEAFRKIGEKKCLSHLLNSPGNFTASKLAWAKKNEPAVFSKTYKMMLSGEYIAMWLTGEILTTPSGLSEGVLWDFKENKKADFVLDHFGIPTSLLPNLTPTFSRQGKITTKAAKETGLKIGIPVTYRAGDQPNNALALNVLQPGEIAATGGTSGVVYGVVGGAKYDDASRVNGFAHVNHTAERPRIGVLLCINGAGSQYRWVKQQIGGVDISYPEMERAAVEVAPGAAGLRILPFGNGAERMLGNRDLGGWVSGLNFNHHTRAHIYRAALEGIAFSFVYGIDILREMGLDVEVMRVGNDNLFQSQIFSQTISNLLGSRIEMLETTGAIGAAKAAGVALGIYSSIEEAVGGGKILVTHEPKKNIGEYGAAYGVWLNDLRRQIRTEK